MIVENPRFSQYSFIQPSKSVVEIHARSKSSNIKTTFLSNGIKLSEQMPKTSLISKSERSFYFFH